MPEPTTNPQLASSVDKLESKAEELAAKLQRITNSEKLWSLVKKSYAQGVEEYNKGNKETAYIVLYRCLMCFTCIRTQKEFQNGDRRYIKEMYGLYVSKAMDLLEELKETLNETYEQQRQKSASIMQGNGKNSIATNEISSDTASASTSASASASASLTNALESLTTTTNNKEDDSYISSKELHAIAADEEHRKSPSILILDIRLKEDFDKSTLKLNDVINIPENIIMIGDTATKLESSLEERFKRFFRKRGDYDRIVIVDWSSVNAIHDSKISVLLSILTKWDPRTKYKSKPVVLKGGFEEWHSTYPNCTTNPCFSRLNETKNNNLFRVDSINYSFFELEKSDKNISSSRHTILKPTVDRSTKPAAIEKKPKPNDTQENLTTTDVDKNHATRIIVASELSKGNDQEVENGGDVDSSIQVHSSNDNEKAAAQDANTNNDRWDEDDDKNRIVNSKSTNNVLNEGVNGSKMKRYSSTPNISKAGLTEDVKPPIDRSTKPSNDDQLNYYTMNSSYIDTGKGLTGLRNIGNTCYMNSIIQCLSNTEPLRKHLCSIDPRIINDESKTRGNVAREIISIMKQLWSSDSGPVSCRSLKNIIGQHNEMFSGYDQQDSHEFLTILIDWLHEDLREPAPTGNLIGANEKTGEKAWGEFVRKNNSIIQRLFYGQLKSTVSCSVCKMQSITFEPFSNLSLPLPSDENKKCSIEDCLKLYTSNDEVDKWQCPKCKDLRRATKKLDITMLPPLLVVHFKRFTSVGGCKKQKTFVDFPDILNMKAFVIGNEHRNDRFQLYAVSNHSGSMESGHYTAYCKNSIDHRWYQFDDQSVYPSSLIKSKEAYIAFYQTIRTD